MRAATQAAIGELALLEDLNLAGNLLVTLPPQIGAPLSPGSKARWHEVTPPGGSAYTRAPVAGNLRRLRSLGLRSNRLTCLPAEVGDLSELEALYLTDNALRQLPRSVGRLRRLRKLQAASNRLEALPDELALLPELVRTS